MEGKKWMLHHDNAPAHVSLLIREFLFKNETTVVPQPPYSSDLAPVDFFLFPKLKSTLKGRRFESIEGIEVHFLTELCAILKKNHSRTVSKTGKNTGSVVLRVEGSTLKVTRPTSF
jgi:transposase